MFFVPDFVRDFYGFRINISERLFFLAFCEGKKMKKKSESNNQKLLYVISKIVLCFAIVLLSLVFCNTRAEALEQISFSKVAKITAPA